MSVSINCFYCLMKNSRKMDSPKRSIIAKTKKRLINSDSRDNENSDVLVSAVISPYLLTHLHHILQQSEYYAQKDGRKSHVIFYHLFEHSTQIAEEYGEDELINMD